MIKLKQLLLESTAPDIFIPRRMEDRASRYINSLIKQYINDGNHGNLVNFIGNSLKIKSPLLPFLI